MAIAFKVGFIVAGGALLTVTSYTQVPDLLNALDAGGRSMGQGGSLNVTNADTLSSFYNPAGLGYIDSRTVAIAYRNLPESRSSITGTRTDPRFSTNPSKGSSVISHLGYAVPLKDLQKGGQGTLAFSYTLGGYVRDIATGPASGLPDGSVTINNYQRTLEARADYYTVAYGRTNSSQTTSYGLGLIFVQQKIDFEETGSAPVTLPSVSSTGNGFGAVLGAQYVPAKMPNMSFGISYRTEINLSNNSSTADLYDKIPARLIAGASYRRDNLRGGKDFAVFGAQFQHFFSANNSIAFPRDAQTTFGFGVEYNYAFENYFVPVRLGYVAVPSGGNGFGRRNSFTYGIGYKPSNSNYGIDLNWATAEGGGTDFAISATYRFK